MKYLVVFVLVVFNTCIFADSIKLNNGNEITGTIWSESSSEVVILPAIDNVYVGGKLSVKRYEIKEIVRNNESYKSVPLTQAEKDKLLEDLEIRKERYFETVEEELDQKREDKFYRYMAERKHKK